MKVVAKTTVRPDYVAKLYYTKGNSVWSYHKKSRAKKVEASDVFTRQSGSAYVLKRSSGGNLVVVQHSMAALRAKGRAKRSANATKRNAKKKAVKAKKKAKKVKAKAKKVKAKAKAKAKKTKRKAKAKKAKSRK